MNEKEISEIRKRFNPDKSNITRIRGCYVNEKKEIISKFDQSLAMMSVEETEKILSLLKRSLSGTIGKNLIDISFSNNQVLDSDEHRLLTALESSSLSDDTAFDKFIGTVTSSLNIKGNYLVLIASDTYDVPSYSSDGVKKEDSTGLYSYILCSICPVKMTKSALGYFVSENKLKNLTPDWIISSPQIGFLFPTFDGRQTNIYNALYYTKDITDSHEELTDALFNSKIPMPAAEQKQLFGTILRDTVANECSLDVIKNVQEKVSEMIEEHKAVKDPVPLTLSKNNVIDILENCGIDSDKIDTFSERFDTGFGKHAEVTPVNIIEPKKLEVRTPDVSIKLSAEMSDKIQTRIIDGQKYILIQADGIVEVNGVEICITE